MLDPPPHLSMSPSMQDQEKGVKRTILRLRSILQSIKNTLLPSRSEKERHSKQKSKVISSGSVREEEATVVK